MNLPLIYNRDGSFGADGWIHIVPKGVLPNPEAGIDQVLDDEALDAIMGSFREGQRRFGNRWPGLYFGEEHHIYDPNKSSAAFGWAKEFDKRDNGIWARPELTDLGSEAIKNKRFKFTSFVSDPKDLEALGGKRYRVRAVETVGFTNLPNGRHLLTPITNRNDLSRDLAESQSADKNKTTNKRTQMKSVAAKLGLSAEASEETILAETSKIMNRLMEAETKLTPLTQRVAALETENGTLLAEQAEALLDAHGVKEEKVRNRLMPVISGLKNRDERIAALLDFGFKAMDPKAAGQNKLFNRDTKPPQGGTSDEPNEAAEKTKAQKIMNRATELQKTHPNLSLATAVSMAQGEN